MKKNPQAKDHESKILSLQLKHENHVKGQIVGPLYALVDLPKEKDPDAFWDIDAENWVNYENGVKRVTRGYFAKWFTWKDAEKIAKRLGVSLEEC